MKKLLNLIKIALCLSVLSLSFYSCKSVPSGYNENYSAQPELSRYIHAKGQLNAKQLAQFFLSKNPSESKAHIEKFASYYISEAAAEGINSDVAFAQMCLETGFLRFGNLVKPEFHNYCGLGSMDAAHPGEVFATEQLGVRAHIQHLHAYGTTSEYTLKNPLIDKRYKYVNPRGKAPTIFELSGTWAMDPNYAAKIESFMQQMELLLQTSK